jgi:hypothetical protein
MMSIGVMSAFLLNLIFRIGATHSATFEFENSDTSAADLERLLPARGRAWSVPLEVVDRAVGREGPRVPTSLPPSASEAPAWRGSWRWTTASPITAN